MARKQFEICQESTWHPGNLWDWSFWIKPLDSTATCNAVRAVTYGLHPAFPNPNRVIRTQETGFRLNMSSKFAQNQTWGSFDVRVTIALKDGERERHTVALKLIATDTGAPAPKLLPLPTDADYETAVRYFNWLKKKSAFGYAREILDRAAEALSGHPASDPQWLPRQQRWIAQQRALCTYKDPTLPNDTRLRRALAILRTECQLSLDTCDDPETLGLGGAVYKRLWDADRSLKDLELSLAYYRRGYELMLERKKQPESATDPSYDAGAFTGANIIYLCEVLALEIPGEADRERHNALRAEADKVRRQLAQDLPGLQQNRPNDWWLAATLLEAHFGLACQDESHRPVALEQAQIAARIESSPWEQQSTGSQLLRAARLQLRLHSASTARIEQLLIDIVATTFHDKVNTHEIQLDGKFGLALSGGGFRASLFHIGVLARMAELDLLRHVEVLSCVSGGSIVGAHYYLLLRDLLQTTPDRDVKQEHYIKLIESLLQQFLTGVQKNIRMRVGASWGANLRMILQPNTYSRTQRLGHLYEEHLYKQVEDQESEPPRWLNELFIIPKSQEGGHKDGFSPIENWRRGAKVPILVLNATTLNTGRNWQFTASHMGEPPSYGTSVDATERLSTVYFNEAPEKWQCFRLGEAVAASSCVPALFTPIVIPDLFHGRAVRLVDGGVQDNQGTRALLDHDCEILVVSDASGQMPSQLNPAHGELGVTLRTNSILQARIRIAQHQELQARERAHLLHGCVFLHLRKGIESPVQNALNHAESVTPQSPKPGAKPDESKTPPTEYGIDCDIQRALSSLRTDLDSFTDREAYTLMYSGYRMATEYLQPLALDVQQPVKVNWAFEVVSQVASGTSQPNLSVASLLHHLRVGSNIAFKVWRLHPLLSTISRVVGVSAGLGVLATLGYLAWNHTQVHIPVTLKLGTLAKSLLIALTLLALGALFPLAKGLITDARPLLNPRSALAQLAFGIAMATLGWILCGIHLCVFDRFFLRLGRIPRPPTGSPHPAPKPQATEGII